LQPNGVAIHPAGFHFCRRGLDRFDRASPQHHSRIDPLDLTGLQQ
jgi:hypothetical protein